MYRETIYRRALEAEPDLQALEAAVYVIAQTARPDEPFCPGCLWEEILKPLVTPIVGWERGAPRQQARDAAPPGVFEAPTALNLSDLETPDIPAPTSDTEKWLRTSEPFDAVTDKWLADLDAAGTAVRAAPGHGIPGRADRPSGRSAHPHGQPEDDE